MSTGMRNVMPWVTLAPNQFEYDNSKANIENWANLGSWMYNLSSGMQELPEAAKVKILNLIKDAKTPEEKNKHTLQAPAGKYTVCRCAAWNWRL